METDTVTTNNGIQMEDNTDAPEEWKGEKKIKRNDGRDAE